MQALKHFEHKFYDVVTVGERGQVVIPAKARKQMGIVAGEKLIAFDGPFGNAIVLMKTEGVSRFAEKITKYVEMLEKKGMKL